MAIMQWFITLARRTWFRVALGLTLCYSLFGFYGLPWLIRHYAPPAVTRLVQRPLTLGQVAFNPFLFKLDANNLALTEVDGTGIFTLRRVYLDFELFGSLINRAPTFAELRLEGPSLNLVQDREGVLNLAKLIASLPPEDPAAPQANDNAPPPRLVLQHIELLDGELSFENQAESPPVVNRAEHLGLELANISTLPDRSGVYEIEAALPEGGTLRWQGDMSLNPVKSQGRFEVTALQLATLMELVGDWLVLAEPGGAIDLSARYQFSREKGDIQVTLEEAVFRLIGLELATAGQSLPLAEFEEFQLGPLSLDLTGQTVGIQSVMLRRGKIHLIHDENGLLNWLTLLKPASGSATPPLPAAPPAPDPQAIPWTVTVEGFNIAELGLDYADGRPDRAVRAAIGDIGLSLQAEAMAGGGEPPVVQVGGIGLHFKDISLDQGQRALLALQNVSLEQASLALPEQQVRVPSILVSKGRISARMDEAGRLDWQALAPAGESEDVSPAPSAAPVAEAPGHPWALNVDQFRFDALALDYADASRKVPIEASVGDFGLSFKIGALAGAGPFQATIDQIAAHLGRFAVRDTRADQPLLEWDILGLEEGHADLAKQDLSLRRLILEGGGTHVIREPDGTVYPASLFAVQESGQPVVEQPATGMAAPPWHFRVDEIAAKGFGLGYQDRSLAMPWSYDFDDLSVSAKNIDNTGKLPIRFDAQAKIRQGGTLNLTGTAAQAGDSAKASFKLDRLNLNPMQAFISDFAHLQLDSAELSADLELGFRQARPQPEIRVTGGTNLANLKLTQSGDGKKFLAWRNLAAQGIDFSLAPDKLSIKELRLVEPDAVIAIHEDRSSNISDVIKSPPAASRPEAKPDRPLKTGKPAGKTPAATSGFPVAISRTLVEKGRVDFSDLSLVLPFATRVHALGGTVAGFTLAPESRATLKLAGRVDDYGEARAEGTLSPMDLKRYCDINVVFRNITMSTLSPYSATFAGRKIESGKLDLDLQYRIEESQLRSTNAITLNRFRLGDAVESPNATSLPLDLAISLLTDSEGKIQASVPIEGHIDDPQFDYASVVGDALVTLITNVVKAPFNALGSMIGLGDEGDPGTVAFDPGQAEIPPPEREKLQKLARGLAERSRLKLIIHGGYDPKADALALKSLAVRRVVAEELGMAQTPGEWPDTVNVTDVASQRALEKLAGRMGGADRMVSAYVQEKGRPPQRVGAMAGLFGKPSETPEFYAMLLADLVERTPLPQSELDTLAGQRGQAVLTELVERQRFDPRRASLGKPGDTREAPDQRIAIRLELALE